MVWGFTFSFNKTYSSLFTVLTYTCMYMLNGEVIQPLPKYSMQYKSKTEIWNFLTKNKSDIPSIFSAKLFRESITLVHVFLLFEVSAITHTKTPFSFFWVKNVSVIALQVVSMINCLYQLAVQLYLGGPVVINFTFSDLYKGHFQRC